MHLAVPLAGLIASAGIIGLGIRFVLQPREATLARAVAGPRRSMPVPRAKASYEPIGSI